MTLIYNKNVKFDKFKIITIDVELAVNKLKPSFGIDNICSQNLKFISRNFYL